MTPPTAGKDAQRDEFSSIPFDMITLKRKMTHNEANPLEDRKIFESLSIFLTISKNASRYLPR